MTMMTCLNPYYTGIHLHCDRETCKKIAIWVLILIILEYIYISENYFWCHIHYYRLNPYYTGIHLHRKAEKEENYLKPS